MRIIAVLKEMAKWASAAVGDKNTLVVTARCTVATKRRLPDMYLAVEFNWDPEVPHLEQRIALAVVSHVRPMNASRNTPRAAGKPESLFRPERRFFTEDCVGERDADTPAYPVFKRDGETIRHFYSGEGNAGMADPGQDPHNAPDMDPL